VISSKYLTLSKLFLLQVSDNNQLRPPPPPEASPELALPWWPFLVLALLGIVIVIIRIRSRRITLTPEKLLEQAIDQAKQSTTDISVHYLHLQKQLCSYLSARLHTRWRSLTSAQVQKEWERAFPGTEHDHAQRIVEAWKNAEFIEFGRGSSDEKELIQLIDLALSLLIKLAPKITSTPPETERNSPSEVRTAATQQQNSES